MTLTWMREQLARYGYRDWSMSVEAGSLPEGDAVLVVRYTVEDSRNPGQEIRLRSRRAIGPFPAPYYDPEESFADALEAALQDVWMHEFWEGFRRDGVLVRDPHADPARWQCPCGGVGPVREGTTWTCPGCKTTQSAEAV